MSRKYFVDNLGRCVAPSNEWFEELLTRGLPKDKQFEVIDFYLVSPTAKVGTVLIHRPKGGLGDMLCVLPAVEDYISKYPDKQITMAIPETYHWIFRHLNVRLNNYVDFHQDGFNQTRNRYYEQFFLWCPAGQHEADTDYRPTEGRLESFAKVLKVGARAPRL